jgi:hypothetical protein
MAKSVAEKLGIRPGSTLWATPVEGIALLGPLPDGVRTVADPAEASTSFVVAPDAAAVRAALDRYADAIRSGGSLWVLYPKGNRADINRDSLWPILAGYRFRPNSQVAIDETWSALRFRPDRDDEAPFAIGR